MSSAGDVPYENAGVTNVEEALDKLLHTPTTVSFTYSAPPIQQKGVILKSYQIRWEFSKAVQSISMNEVALAITARSYTEEDDISADKTYKFVYSDGIESYNKDIPIRFYNGIYYGVSTSIDYNADLINSLTKKLQTSNRIDFTVNAGAGQYIYYACPTSYGQPIFTINGLDVIYDKMIEFNFTNSNGHVEKYAIYRSTYAGLGALNISSR